MLPLREPPEEELELLEPEDEEEDEDEDEDDEEELELDAAGWLDPPGFGPANVFAGGAGASFALESMLLLYALTLPYPSGPGSPAKSSQMPPP